MKIVLAQSAGFCYGVRRAVELAEATAAKGEPCVMLGSIIHNQDMIDHLARYVYEIYQCKSVSVAAEKLYLSQQRFLTSTSISSSNSPTKL